MLRTVLPALAQAVVMNLLGKEGTSENLKEKLQVHSAIICFFPQPGLHINVQDEC